MCDGFGHPDREPQQLDQAFHALADGNRRAIVARLTRGGASVSELAAPLGVSLPTVLQHLDVLQRSGLVRSEKVGRVRICKLEPGPMTAVEQWIHEHRADWETSVRPPGRRPRRRLPDHEGTSQQMSIRQHLGNHHLFRSRFHDIVDAERIVFAYDMLLDGCLTSVSLTTIELRHDDGGGTHLIFTQHGAFLDDLEEPAEREHGTGLLLDGLEAFLIGEVPA